MSPLSDDPDDMGPCIKEWRCVVCGFTMPSEEYRPVEIGAVQRIDKIALHVIEKGHNNWESVTFDGEVEHAGPFDLDFKEEW